MELQKIQSKVINLAESGLSPEMIANRIMEENEISANNYDDPEAFSDGMKVVAQALAFRRANVMDCTAITRLINIAYKDETEGVESFRSGECVTKTIIMGMLNDKEYLWQLVEAPNGFGVEEDGQLIAVSCFTVNGTSRKNGVVEGKAGSIRFLAVLPRYRGLCVGLRLLNRIERYMLESGCCRSIASIPSTRGTLQRWIERREYELAGTIPYPTAAVGHVITASEPVSLLVYHKSLFSEHSKNSIRIRTKQNNSDSASIRSQSEFRALIAPPPPPTTSVASKICLSPQWRQCVNMPQMSCIISSPIENTTEEHNEVMANVEAVLGGSDESGVD